MSAAAASAQKMPLSLKILVGFMIVGLVFSLFGLPAVLEAGPLAAAQGVAGIVGNLLLVIFTFQRKPWAWKFALGWFGFNALTMLVGIARLPATREDALAKAAAAAPQLSPETLALIINLTLALTLALTAVYLLSASLIYYRNRAFFEGAREPVEGDPSLPPPIEPGNP